MKSVRHSPQFSVAPWLIRNSIHDELGMQGRGRVIVLFCSQHQDGTLTSLKHRGREPDCCRRQQDQGFDPVIQARTGFFEVTIFASCSNDVGTRPPTPAPCIREGMADDGKRHRPSGRLQRRCRKTNRPRLEGVWVDRSDFSVVPCKRLSRSLLNGCSGIPTMNPLRPDVGDSVHGHVRHAAAMGNQHQRERAVLWRGVCRNVQAIRTDALGLSARMSGT